MLLTRLDPLFEFANMQKTLDTLTKANTDTSISSFAPSVNTREGEYAYHIEIDLPGIKKEDVKIDLDDKRMTVYGERTLKEEVKEEDYYKVETSLGKFQRVFNLPENIDKENISATSVDGVLEITIPKLKDNTAIKQIKVN